MTLFNFVSSLNDFLVFADTLNINPGTDDLEDELFAIYEWEYKYHKLKNSENTHPKRKEKLLERIEREITPVLFSATEKLAYVYEEWLRSHDINDPVEWAHSRINLDANSAHSILVNALNQYKNYFDASNEQAYSAFIHSNYQELLPQIKNLYELQKQSLKEDMNQVDDEDTDEYQYYEQQLKELNNMYHLDNFTTGLDFLDEHDLMEELIFLSIHEEDPRTLLLNFYSEKLFEGWYRLWASQGLDETIENVQEMYNELKNISGKPLSKKFSIFNKALNTSHQTGSMMEYVESTYGVSHEILDTLSKLDTTSTWDSNLKMLGVR